MASKRPSVQLLLPLGPTTQPLSALKCSREWGNLASAIQQKSTVQTPELSHPVWYHAKPRTRLRVATTTVPQHVMANLVALVKATHAKLSKTRHLRSLENTNTREDHTLQDVVGYIRVSTSRQAELGGSLDEQAYVLRGYCQEKKLNLVTIEEDDCSAAGAQGHLYRPGLREAIRIAKDKGAAILVPSVDRLARHPAVLDDIFVSNVPVISIAERRRVGRSSLELLLHDAQRDCDEIAGRAREGMKRAKKRGVRLGSKTNLDIAQRNGAISNVARADRKTQELADFIERTPGWDNMVLWEKVDALNRSGPHNCLTSSVRNVMNAALGRWEVSVSLLKRPKKRWCSGAKWKVSLLRSHRSGAGVCRRV